MNHDEEPDGGSRNMEESAVGSMMLLVFLAFVLLVAVLSPWLGTDTSDARSERAHPSEGWWPGRPAQNP